jgi:hypothetical protein
MALDQYYRAFDLDLAFSNAVALTVTTATYSSELNLGSTQMGKGKPIQVVVQVQGITATAASTILVEVAAGSATAPTTFVQDISTAVTGSANFEKHFTLPADVAKFVRLRYTLTGSAASACTITAFATAPVN